MQDDNLRKSVVVPMYNERENIIPLVDSLLKVSDDFFVVLSVTVSPDGTEKITERLAKKESRVFCVYADKGLGKAYCQGFKKALELKSSLVVTMDADFSHSPEDISRLFKKGKNYDLVIGSRFVQGGKTVGWGRKRKARSWIARSFSKAILGIKSKDCTSGFKCYGKELIQDIISRNPISRGYAFQVESVVLAEKQNKNIYEIPITFTERKKGKSKAGAREIRQFIGSIFKMRMNISSFISCR